MSLSHEITNQVFSLPAPERFALAQQLLDSIDEKEAARLDAAFIGELKRRREEMLQGAEIVADWRQGLSEIDESFGKERKD